VLFNANCHYISIGRRDVVVNALVADQRSCSTPGPVTTWMGDRMQIGKPSRYVTNHLGQLSQPLGSINRVPAWLAGVKAACVHLCRVAGNTV